MEIEMDNATATLSGSKIPAHVPEELVVDLDIYDIPGGDIDPQLAWRAFKTKGPLSYSIRNGGHWIATDGTAVFEFFRNATVFSNRVITIPDVGPHDRQLPIQADAPDHVHYRRNIMQFFTADAIAAMEDDVRKLCIDLIEEIRPRGQCEFVREFAFQFPLTIFLRMMGLPLDDRLMLRGIVERFTDTPDLAIKAEAHRKLHAYIDAVIADRIARPDRDAITHITKAEINGRPYTLEEMRATIALLLHAGLDTVAGMLSFMVLDFARHPERQDFIAANLHNTSAMHQVVQEFLRRFPIVNMSRILTKDYTYEGVEMKEGELIILCPTFFNMDAARIENPDTIELDRKSSRHISFGSGPHTCAGALLAREELRIFLEEWTKRMPPVKINPASPPRMHAMPLNGVRELKLCWNV